MLYEKIGKKLNFNKNGQENERNYELPISIIKERHICNPIGIKKTIRGYIISSHFINDEKLKNKKRGNYEKKS